MLLVNLESCRKSSRGWCEGRIWRSQPGLRLHPGISDLCHIRRSIFYGFFFKLQYCVSTEMLFWSGAGWVFTLLLSGLWGRGSWCAKTRAGLWEAAGLGSAGSEAGIDTNVTFPACSTPPTAPPTLFAGAKCKHLLGGVWRLCCRWLHGFCLMFSLNTNLGASVASSGWG